MIFWLCKSYQHSKNLCNSINQYFLSNKRIMLQNQSYMCNWYSKCKTDLWVLILHSIKKLIDRISNSTRQLILKKPPYVKYWYSIKEEYPQLERLLNAAFPTIYLCEDRFFICFNQSNIWQKQRRCSMSVQLPSSVCSWLGVCYNLYNWWLIIYTNWAPRRTESLKKRLHEFMCLLLMNVG